MDDDTRLDVAILGRAVSWRMKRVVVQRNAGRVDVQLIVPREGESGALVLEVVDSVGASVASAVRYRVLDPSGSMVFLDRALDLQKY